MISDTLHEKMKGWFARIILGLLILSFALFGIETYNKSGAGVPEIAEVGNTKIYLQNYEEILKQQQNKLREVGQNNPKVLNSDALKNEVLTQMINERLMVLQATKLGYSVNEAGIIAQIQSNPAWQENGKFSEQRFQAALDGAHLARKQYVTEQIQDKLKQDLIFAQALTVISSRALAAHMAGILAEQREISRGTLSAASFLDRVKIDDAQIKEYYDKHPELTQVPEQARVQYIVFTPEVVLSQLQVSDADAQAYYQSHLDRFSSPESREVAHILIRANRESKPEQIKAAQEKAQQVFEQATKAPQKFAELAKQFSQDPISAGNGGSLGFIQPGTIFPEVEKLAFGMTAGEVRGPVQSNAGFHIVLLKSVKPRTTRSFEEVKGQVLEAAKRELAVRKFNEEVEPFGDLVYSKNDSLQPAADKYKLQVQTTDWIGRQGPAQGILKHERLLNAVFSSDVTKNKRNTEAIEVAPNTLVAARILEYKAAGNKPLAEVKGLIESILRKDKASAMASEQGKAMVDNLRQAKAVDVKFDAPIKIGRDDLGKHGLDGPTMQAIYRVSAKKLPAYTGVTLANGDYAVFKISAVSVNDKKRQEIQQSLPQAVAQRQADVVVATYLDSLRRDGKVKIRQEALNKIGAE